MLNSCLVILGIGSLNLRSRKEALTASEGGPGNSPRTGRFFDAVVLVSIPIYILLNLTILIVVAIKPYVSSDGGENAFPGWGFPVIIAVLLGAGTIYYLLFFGAACRCYEPLATSDDSDDETSRSRVCRGILAPNSGWNLMKHAGVRCIIHKDYSYKNIERVSRFGRRWEMVYAIQGVDDEVYLSYNPLRCTSLTYVIEYWQPSATRWYNHHYVPLLGIWWYPTEG
jgi:hypothetical protein